MRSASRLTLRAAREALCACARPSDVAVLSRFFKTGPGEYGEGDRFIGVRVPATRRVARRFMALPLEEIVILLQSPVHEERLLALVIMTERYRRAEPSECACLYRLYMDNTRHINNWDLVDVSAEHIVGAYLWTRSRKTLDRLAISTSLWDRRIAIMATFHFIRRGDYADTLRVAQRLLADREDLIHKAVGWMLREVGNRDRAVEETFLRNVYHRMPRTMLRYAIERFPESLRLQYLKGVVRA